MLEELAKNDKLWREIAFRITSNHDDADELVQKMYIRMASYNKDFKDISKGFIKVVLVNLFLDSKRKPYYKQEYCKDFNEGLTIELVTKQPENSYTDRDLIILKKIENLSDYDRNLLELSYAHSLRDIEKITGVNYVKVLRDLDWTKIRVLGSKQKR